MWATPLRCPHIHRPACAARSVAALRRVSSAQWRDDNLPIGRHGADLNCQARVRRRAPHGCRARMPGHYSTRCRRRPCRSLAEAAEGPARLFLCARCQAQVLICSCCDRGQIYCAGGCAREVRHQAQRAAGRSYQASRRGRVNHAARARRWRARQKNVTHQGSPSRPPDDGVSVDATVTASDPPVAPSSDVESPSRGGNPPLGRCCWCGRRCPPFVRMGFLRRRWRDRSRDQTSRRAS